LLGGLGVCMLGLLALPSESSKAGPALTTLPVTTRYIEPTIDSQVTREYALSQPSLVASTTQATANAQRAPVSIATPITSTANPLNWEKFEIASGDSLSSLFGQVGLNDGDLFTLLNSSAEAKVLNRIYPGYKLEFNIPATGRLEQLRVLKNPLEGYLFTRNDSGYSVDTIIKTPEIRHI